MTSQLKNIVVALMLAALSLGAVEQAQASRLIAGGYSYSVRFDGEVRTVTFVSVYHKGKGISGWAEFEHTDIGTFRHDITSAVLLDDGTLCMAGPITAAPDPNVIGWTGFFAVRDNGKIGEDPDQVSQNLIAPPEYADAQSILDFIGGSVPEDKFIPIDGGKVKVFVK